LVPGDILHEEGVCRAVSGDLETGAGGGHEQTAGGGGVEEVSGEVVVALNAADTVPVDLAAAGREGAGFVGVEFAEIGAEPGNCGFEGGGVGGRSGIDGDPGLRLEGERDRKGKGEDQFGEEFLRRVLAQSSVSRIATFRLWNFHYSNTERPSAG